MRCRTPAAPRTLPLMSLIETETSATAPKPAREPRISKRMRKAIDALAKGQARTQKAAAGIAGVSECHLSRMMQKAQFQAFLAQRTRETLAIGAIRASTRLAELVDSQSDNVAFHASVQSLRFAGFAPSEASQTNVQVNVQPGYVVHLPVGEDDARPAIDGDNVTG